MANGKGNILVAFYSRDGSAEALAKAVVEGERAKPEAKCDSVGCPISFLRP
jgi:hypothetical protein